MIQSDKPKGSDSDNSTSPWQRHFNYIRESESFNDSEKELVLSGLLKLSNFFNDDWLKKAETGYPRHPLVSYISNYAPWSQFWLVDFADRLDFIKNTLRFSELMERLKHSEQYGGAEPESHSTYRLQKVGFEVELYPKIGLGKRKADIKAIVDDVEYFFEISSLQSSMKANASSHTFDSLTFPYSFQFHDEILIQCKIHKSLAEPRLQELRKKIEQAINRVRRNRKFEYIGEPGIMDYLIIHKDVKSDLDTLLHQHGMQKEISGPPFALDDVRRLEAKFWDEIKQLPRNKPGVIVIYGNLTFFSGDASHFYGELAYEIEDTVYSHDNLVMAVVVGREAGYRDGATWVEKPNYAFSKVYLNDLLSQSTLIVQNRYSQFANLPYNERIAEAFAGIPNGKAR